MDKLRQRLSPDITLREFCYDTEHLSLLEGTTEAIASDDGSACGVGDWSLKRCHETRGRRRSSS